MRTQITKTTIKCDVCNTDIYLPNSIVGCFSTYTTVEEMDLCAGCSCKFIEYLYSSKKIDKTVMLEAIDDIKSRLYVAPPGVTLC